MLTRHRASVGTVALALACIMLLALRVPIAAMPAMWIDEAFSVYHAHGSLAHLWAEGWRLESSPPLYYTVLWAWIRVAGDGEFGARLLSLALSAGSTAFVYAAARTLAGRVAGAVAALTWLMPALAFEYSIEIRPYALQHLCIAAAIHAFARALVKARSGRLGEPRAVAESLAPIVLASTAAFYTHTTSFAFIAGLAGSAAAYGFATRAGRGYAIAWATACGVTAVLCLPQALAAAGVAESNRAGLAWMPPTYDLLQQSRLWRQFALGHVNWNFVVTTPLAGAVHGALAAAAWRMRSRPEVFALGVGVSVLGLVAMVIAGALQSVLLPRTVLWLWLPLAVLVGCAAGSFAWRTWPPRVAAVAALGLAAATTFAFLEDRPVQRPWPHVIRELNTRVGRDDRVLVLDPEVGCLLERYADGNLRAALRARIEPGPRPRFRGQRLDIGCNQLPAVAPESIARLAHGTDWVLTGDDTQRRELEALLRGDPTLQVTEQIVQGGRTHATRVRQRPASS